MCPRTLWSLTCYRVGKLVPEEVLAHEPLGDGVGEIGFVWTTTLRHLYFFHKGTARCADGS